MPKNFDTLGESYCCLGNTSAHEGLFEGRGLFPTNYLVVGAFSRGEGLTRGLTVTINWVSNLRSEQIIELYRKQIQLQMPKQT